MIGNKGFHNSDLQIKNIKQKLNKVNALSKEEAGGLLIKLYCSQDLYENLFHYFNESLKYQYSLKVNSGDDLHEYIKKIFLPKIEDPLKNELDCVSRLKKEYLEARKKLVSLGVGVSEFSDKLDYLEQLN